MSDTALNKVIQYGTNAERLAFTPDPAAGSQVLYLWYETDNEPDIYAWNGSSWEQINSGSAIWARVYHNANQSISHDTATALAFNSERADTDTIHDTSTNNSRLTCKTAGVYTIVGQCGFDANGTGLRELQLKLNGSTLIAIKRVPNTGSGDPAYIDVTTIYSLAVNDYVEMFAKQTSGGSLDVISAGNFSPEFMMRLGS